MTTPPFVATDLTILEAPEHADPATDLLALGKAYRALDPDYYAWLRHKMELARSAYSQGRLLEPTFDALRDRFNAVHDLAVSLFGMGRLLEASWRLDPKRYPRPGLDAATTRDPEPAKDAPQPIPSTAPRCSSDDTTPSRPSPAVDDDPLTDHEHPDDAEGLPHLHAVRQSALDKVHAIEATALAAGWTHAELYANRGRFAFPFGGDYGLVCFVHPDHVLGRVSPRAIEIVCPSGHSQHYYRRGALP